VLVNKGIVTTVMTETFIGQEPITGVNKIFSLVLTFIDESYLTFVDPDES
jgi:hypothetical protein